MEIICKNVLRLQSGATFSDLLSMPENIAKNQTDVIEICLPNSYAVKEKRVQNIDSEKCFGCLNCIDNNEIEFVNNQFVPKVDRDQNISLSSMISKYFLGDYPNLPSSANKLSRHSSTDETRIAHPMAAFYLWRLSSDPSRTFFCSSPSWELSLPTTNPWDQREGHIDVVVLSYSTKTVFVLEGKSTLDSFLRDRQRDQWNRYYQSLKNTAAGYGYKMLFFYSIGGDELGLYPSIQGIPHHGKRKEFYDFIVENDKRFLSLESLRVLRAWQISSDSGWNWEQWFPRLYESKDFVGFLSGGVVVKDGEEFNLKRAPWV